MTITVKAGDTADGFDLIDIDDRLVGSLAMGDNSAELTLADIPIVIGVNNGVVPVGDSTQLDMLLRDAGYTIRHDDRDRVHNLVDSYGEDEDPS